MIADPKAPIISNDKRVCANCAKNIYAPWFADGYGCRLNVKGMRTCLENPSRPFHQFKKPVFAGIDYGKDIEK
ncbi:MAG: hypothetical protein K9L23_13085 [Desulfotignum sp.]|nr:hypothetical protein [Desulfotignum sp.]MCF8125540.1 hypothetical protein [Desulfotignum sp.]